MTVIKRIKGLAVFYAVLILALAFVSIQAQKKFFPQPPPSPVLPPQAEADSSSMMAALAQIQNYSASRISSYHPQGGPRDNFWIPTDGREVTLAEIKGPGAITHIWMTHRGGGRDLILRMYWDGSAHPSVEAPAGDFFGVAMGLDAVVNSIPIQVSSEGRSRNCWWYMPFNKQARVTVGATRSEENLRLETVPLYFYIDYRVYGRPVKDIHYFHSRFREIDPAPRGQSLLLAETEGEGHFVGLVMGHRARMPGWFGEGDDIITVDGQVSFLGTGTEDYFCDAWGFRVFSDLYHGVPALEGREEGNRLSAYRFHILDPIPFRKSFRFELEHWPWMSPWPNTGRDYFSGQSFWYQKNVHKPWPRLEKILSLEPWDPNKGRWQLEGALEAEDMGILSFESAIGKSARPVVQRLLPNLSGDHMLAFDSGGKGFLSLAVPVEQDGLYEAMIHFVRAPDYGIVALEVNGKAVGEPVDTFLKTDDLTRPVWPPRGFIFQDIFLKEGLSMFRFQVNDKNKDSEGYKIGIDCLVLKKKG
jgi:hypothetical protein